MITIQGAIATQVDDHGPRDFNNKKHYIQCHQCDYDPANLQNMLTNYCVDMMGRANVVHDISKIVDHNYKDFVHIEVGGVWFGLIGKENTVNRVVEYKGKHYTRTPSHMTPAIESGLEECIVHAFAEFAKHGIVPILITHRQTFASRVYDPGEEIARAVWRIAMKYGFPIDFDFVRPSGQRCPVEWKRP